MEEQIALINPALEKLRWKKIPVLDDGFVCLVDCMGTDSSVVQAARVSYGQGTKKVSDDKTLIRYLMRMHHGTPFEMCEIKFLLRIPMDAWRQGVRHRVFSINEVSSRYSIITDDPQKTDRKSWRVQAKDNKQGSDGFLSEDIGSNLSEEEEVILKNCKNFYEKCLDQGIAREQARKNLPLCTYTELYWKGDLRGWFHFLKLRMDSHAQLEIRCYANAIAEIIKQLYPLCYEAFEDYVLNSMNLSNLDICALKQILKQIGFTPILTLPESIHPSWNGLTRCRERDEFVEKLKILGIIGNE